MVSALQLAMYPLRAAALAYACYLAFTIRLYAVNKFGRVIHEFDPWFNFRATEYLVDHGPRAFFDWYDEMVWYPLGRPVGTTIYPGLQFVSAGIFYLLQAIGQPMTINDVCVFVPPLFAIFTTLATGALAYEVFRNADVAVASAAVMAISPAHLMRSIAGGYDNESIAVFAMVLTFYLYVRSLRSPTSGWLGVLTGLSYFFMVAAWGGYVFVLNLIALHGAVTVLIGRYTTQLHLGYTLFYVIGTVLAIQLPIVGWTPLKSMEQLSGLATFALLQLEYAIRLYRWNRVKAYGAAAAAAAVVVAILMPTGYFGPLSARVRGLFVEHTKTGNPLVDSVAEHQATPASMYVRYLHHAYYLGFFGFIGTVIYAVFKRDATDAELFLFLYALTTAYFSRKMVRLLLLLGAPSSIYAGTSVALMCVWSLQQFGIGGSSSGSNGGDGDDDDASTSTSTTTVRSGSSSSSKKGKKAKKTSNTDIGGTFANFKAIYDRADIVRKLVAVLLLFTSVYSALRFYEHCQMIAPPLSQPSVITEGRYRDGTTVIIDDFREAYFWLRDNTPEDARVLSWWDYGYQINGMANRTTIADGNTWNHEHIALLGRALVSDVKTSHKIIRHLADYVLVWSTRYGGNPGDDIAKSPHLARIAGSVYSAIDPAKFSMDRDGRPSPMMANSLIFRAVTYRMEPGTPEFPPGTYKEVKTTKNNMVRIYKVLNVSPKSKAWGKQGHGKRAWIEERPLTDAYPPGLQEVLREKRDFKQH